MLKCKKFFTAATLKWIIFLLMLIGKYAYYGYTYFPIVDDNNQYGVYFNILHTSNNVFKTLILGNSVVYSTRPLAGILDVYFWARFWEHLGMAFFAITILQFVICVLLYKIFKKLDINLGIIVFIVFGLLPSGSEATYWLSASTRVVIGLFFMVLSIYFLCNYIKNQNKYVFLILMFITNLISMGFYEQVISWGFVMIALVFIMCWSKLQHKWIIIIPIINNLLIVMWYKVFNSSSDASNRVGLVSGDYIRHTWHVCKRMYQLIYANMRDLINLGLPKSISIILQDNAYIFFSIIILLGVSLFVYLINQKTTLKQPSNILLKFSIGVILFVAAYIPFFLLEQIWICNRNLFISFIGLGIIIDALLDLLHDGRIMRICKSFLISALAIILLISNVYELSYYKTVYETDNKLVDGFIQLAKAENINKPILIVNSDDKLFVQTISPRIGICIGANWAFKGAVNARYPNFPIGNIVTISKNQWGYTKITAKEVMDSLVITTEDNILVSKLIPKQFANGEIGLINKDGKNVGEIHFISNNQAAIK